jgi:hypothetical protein
VWIGVGWVLVVSWCWSAGWCLPGQLVGNDLVTIWGLGLFGVVFGLWLWDDFSVIIRGHFYRLREYVYLF